MIEIAIGCDDLFSKTITHYNMSNNVNLIIHMKQQVQVEDPLVTCGVSR